MLENATIKFREKIANEIRDHSISKFCHGKDKTIPISRKTMKQNCMIVCPTKPDADQFIGHYETLERYLPFCSPRESFAKLLRTSFDNRNDLSYLDKNSVEELRKSGARFHTIRAKNDMVFDTSGYQSGVQYGKEKSTRGLISTIGNKDNEYEDVISPDGFVTYEPPCNQAGFLRYRWIQFLKQKYEIPMFFLFAKWFALTNPIPDVEERKKFHAQKGKIVFMITPVTVVTSAVQMHNANFFEKVSDLNNLGELIDSPLPLQMIEPDECFQMMYSLNIMHSKRLLFQNRQHLPTDLVAKYNYDTLRGTHLEKQLEQWAKNSGKKCPDGQSCTGQEFAKIPKLHLGHIISRNWCQAFKFDEKLMNHPYNLYLTCGSCNQSLHKHFPHKKLQRKIDEEKATIGDWAYYHDAAIRNTRIK